MRMTPIEEEGWMHPRVIELVIWMRLDLSHLVNATRDELYHCFLRTTIKAILRLKGHPYEQWLPACSN